MKTLASVLNRTVVLTTLPVVLAFAGCSKKSDPVVTPTPDQGKVMLVHAAPSANLALKVVANDSKELGQVTYGQSSGYVSVVAGAQSLKINNAASGATIAAQALTVDKDKNYSVFAYSPATTLGSIAALGVSDDLTAPSAGKAKIRFVHLGVSAPSTLSLSVPGPVTGTVDIIPNVAFGTASAFTELAPQAYNLSISTGSGATGMVKVYVGDGTGTGPSTATRTYAAGKIYTVVLRGIDSNSVSADQQLKAVVIENN